MIELAIILLVVIGVPVMRGVSKFSFTTVRGFERSAEHGRTAHRSIKRAGMGTKNACEYSWKMAPIRELKMKRT